MAIKIHPDSFYIYQQTPHYLGIDTGGTHSRGIVFKPNESGGLEKVAEAEVNTDDHDLYGMLVKNLIEKSGWNIVGLVGVAAGIPGTYNKNQGEKGSIDFTNSRSMPKIDLKATADLIKEQLDVDIFACLNDLEAITWGILEGNATNEVVNVHRANYSEDSPETTLVLADGTGLGAGIGHNIDGVKMVPHSEGGHLGRPYVKGWSPEKNSKLISYLERKNHWDAEAEDVLSGRGLVDLYLFVNGLSEMPDELKQSKHPAAEIVRKALDGKSDCLNTMIAYVQVYGNEARNFAMANVAQRVCLTGNAYKERNFIVKDGLAGQAFWAAYYDGARYRDNYLKGIKIDVVKPGGLGERGAAHYLQNLHETLKRS